jgi:hypothetical protein
LSYHSCKIRLKTREIQYDYEVGLPTASRKSGVLDDSHLRGTLAFATNGVRKELVAMFFMHLQRGKSHLFDF